MLLFAILLGVGTLVLFSPVRSHDFIDFDDQDYVAKNPHVTSGLTWQTIRWSFVTVEQANWHPITWLSHALDCQLFGLDAGDHHLTSAVIHALNALLLFLLLQRITGSSGRSFFVAALFAWHPFNVESVAWIAERKNLVSTLFFFLTLGTYGWYALQPRLSRMAAVVTVFALALASKPMVVSLPFVLLLLDYWPLQRVADWTNPSTCLPIPQQSVRRLLLEKWPLFALSVASSGVTVWAQRSGGAVRSLQSFPFVARLENALYAYVIYIWKTFWPFGFSVHYPHPGTSLALWKWVLAAGVLLAVSLAVGWQRQARPYLIVGWLWFLGTMVPVIGIVQVGDQAMANRYSYLPLIGLFAIAAWGSADLFDLLHVNKVARWAIAFLALATLSFLSFQEIGYWQNSVTIWSRALEVMPENLHIEEQLANALAQQGDAKAAMPHLLNIEQLDPEDAPTHANLGSCYAMRGEMQEAIREFETVIKLTTHENLMPLDRMARSSAQLNLGFAYAQTKDYAKALASLRGADQTNPAMIDSTMESFGRNLVVAPADIGFSRLSLLLEAKGNNQGALSILEKAVEKNPNYASSTELLGYLRGTGADAKQSQ